MRRNGVNVVKGLSKSKRAIGQVPWDERLTRILLESLKRDQAVTT